MKQTFIVAVETDKKNFVDWIAEHDEQVRADYKRENEQDTYHRRYIDGQAKCSFDNEMKIRADERAKTLIEIIDFIKYECCLEDRITKVLDKAEQLKEKSNE